MLIDLHSHTERCGHAVGATSAYVERALELGLAEYGISDHSPWMIQNPGEHLAMRPDELAGYVDEVRQLQATYNRSGPSSFTVRLGLEMDWAPSRMALAREAIERYEWDYLIGSAHTIGLWGLSDRGEAHLYDRYRIEDICELYFQQVGDMIRARFCDVLAHLDLPKRFGHRPSGGFRRWIEPLVGEIKEAGMAVEINTSGRDLPIGEVFPDWEIIELLHEAGVPLTLGSDAHAPENVGRHFPEVLTGLAMLGIRELVRFEQREMIGVTIVD